MGITPARMDEVTNTRPNITRKSRTYKNANWPATPNGRPA
jgi:hypothetical protein